MGAEHPDTAWTLSNLAHLYTSHGKYNDAEPLFKQSLAIREKVLGAEHPETAWTLNKLARLYEKQLKYQDAEPLYKRALAIREKVFGPEHIYTIKFRNDLDLFLKLKQM